jgi:hypothetical protein
MTPNEDARLVQAEVPANQPIQLSSFEPLIDKLAGYGVVFLLCLCLLIYLTTELIRETKKRPRARKN